VEQIRQQKQQEHQQESGTSPSAQPEEVAVANPEEAGMPEAAGILELEEAKDGSEEEGGGDEGQLVEGEGSEERQEQGKAGDKNRESEGLPVAQQSEVLQGEASFGGLAQDEQGHQDAVTGQEGEGEEESDGGEVEVTLHPHQGAEELSAEPSLGHTLGAAGEEGEEQAGENEEGGEMEGESVTLHPHQAAGEPHSKG